MKLVCEVQLTRELVGSPFPPEIRDLTLSKKKQTRRGEKGEGGRVSMVVVGRKMEEKVAFLVVSVGGGVFILILYGGFRGGSLVVEEKRGSGFLLADYRPFSTCSL